MYATHVSTLHFGSILLAVFVAVIALSPLLLICRAVSALVGNAFAPTTYDQEAWKQDPEHLNRYACGLHGVLFRVRMDGKHLTLIYAAAHNMPLAYAKGGEFATK